MKKLFLTLAVISSVLPIAACHDEDDNGDNSSSSAQRALPLLREQGKFYIMEVRDFNSNQVFLHSFTPPTSDKAPTNSEPDTINDLSYDIERWIDNSEIWSPASNQLDNEQELIGTRNYRVLSNGKLAAPFNGSRRPIFEALDGNIYERYLATSYIWDTAPPQGLSTTDRDVASKSIKDYEQRSGYIMLKNATTWAKDNQQFSSGALLIGASRNVDTDVFVIESVPEDSNSLTANTYSFKNVKFGIGVNNIDAALASYPLNGVNGNSSSSSSSSSGGSSSSSSSSGANNSGARLPFKFTTNYGMRRFEPGRNTAAAVSPVNTIYLTFSVDDSRQVKLYNSPSNDVREQVAQLTFTKSESGKYIEIPTSTMAAQQRQQLGLPSTFNLIIAGPFTSDGTDSNDFSNQEYYMGKHYIRTTTGTRTNLNPTFFLNPAAYNNVKETYRNWRVTERAK